jgi:hypothetical protein
MSVKGVDSVNVNFFFVSYVQIYIMIRFLFCGTKLAAQSKSAMR